MTSIKSNVKLSFKFLLPLAVMPRFCWLHYNLEDLTYTYSSHMQQHLPKFMIKTAATKCHLHQPSRKY